jgi:dihydropteroate synthase
MKPRPRFTLQIRKRRERLGERTLVMGVLNVTPDSFSDGGLFLDPERAIEQGLELVRQGADWIDVGGESTRPGSKPIPVEEELRRVLPVIQGLHRMRPSLPISIDTTKAEVAEAAAQAGATIINDVSGLRFDPRIAEVARKSRTALVLMHLRGRPETMQQQPFARSVWRSLREGLSRSIRRALAAGVRRSQIILDPGLGFGTSRKSFVQAVVRSEGLQPGKRGVSTWPLMGKGALRAPEGGQSLPLQIGDAAAVATAILVGAHIVRVHDVAAVLPAVRIADAILDAANYRS